MNKVDQLTSWRRPYGAITPIPGSQLREPIETRGLREAVYELIGDEPVSIEEIAAAVREHWGEAGAVQIGRALTSLQRDGAIRRVGGRYARREAQR